LLTSRTGIEFVDLKSQHWQIHHWVRGACLYGILPANGLVYTAPHPCACYLEAKQYGFNALAPASPSRAVPREVADEGRLERGPAYDAIATSTPNAKRAGRQAPDADEWPTYRHDSRRSGATPMRLQPELQNKWLVQPAGKGRRLTAPTVANDKLYVADVDAHTLYALDAKTGKVAWRYIAGGRIDSPPTLWHGLVLFGAADGWVYCLRQSDGRLVWRYRAAPAERYTVVNEQVESLWPVHGSVLVDRDGVVWCVAGRSMFLDGGLRLLRIEATTCRKVAEHIWDDRVPGTEKSLQEIIRVLNMPVALPDILSADDKYVYMRSQRITWDGQRVALDTPLGRVNDQAGEGAHLFSPTGFLDDSYWHRTYWVYGKRWMSGAGGYFRAGRYAPAGRLLVFDDENVYGYGRKPQFYKWTTAMERHMFACSKAPKTIRIRPPDRRPGFRATRPVEIKIETYWTKDVSIYATALVKAADLLFVAGPPDIINELQTLRAFDTSKTQKLLERQDELLGGDQCTLLVVRASDGQVLTERQLPSQPVWDGMAAAYGCLFVSLKNGQVICLAAE